MLKRIPIFYLWPALLCLFILLSQRVKATDSDYVAGIFKKIQDSGRYVNALSNQDMGALPVGLVREINGKIYVIAIDSARITPTGAYFSAYFRFTFPGTNEELIFGGKNIAFTPGGISAGSGTKLVLLNDKPVKINEHVDLVLPGNGTNYIEWDCNGFKDVNISGNFEFDKGWIEPEDKNTDKVRVALQVNASDLNNIMAAVSMPAFHISGLDDFTFSVQQAVVDMSDIANPDGAPISKDMLDDPGSPTLWRGFYLKDLKVQLPAQLATANGRPTIDVKNFFLDDQGVSGTVSAENIIRLGDASAGGWPLSIEKAGLTFSKNKLSGGELGGKMQISFLGDDPLGYTASISMQNNKTNYSFSLNTTANKTYEFFAGQITLNKDSRIQVTKTDNDFLPVATLNGKVNLKKNFLNVDSIAFKALTLSTQKPYVHSGTFDFSGQIGAKIAGYGIDFDSLELGISEGKIAIGGRVHLNLMNAGDKGFSASTTFAITANQQEHNETVNGVTKTSTKWQFDKLTVNDIDLDVKVMAFSMHGILTIFDNHPVYGNGFRGMLDFSIPGPIPKARATAYFGTKDDYRYWHVDAYVGATIPMGTLTITGLMGGMSYHMERPADFDPYATRNSIDQKGGLLKDVSEIFQYVPSKDAGLGFMGGVSLAFVQKMVINANVALEVQFGTDGGFRYAQFDGAGYVLHADKKATSAKDAAADVSAPLWVQFKMRYDNINSTFDANIKTYMNIAGVLKGLGENGLVGEAVMHVAPDEWWFYIGRPSQMFGVNIAGLAQVQTYFMMGTKVENMPPVPSEVSAVFDNVNTDFMAAENAMSTGAGFGFGAHFKAGFSFDFGVYGDFALGAGADILLRNYGEAKCKGSNSVIGFNGWYASGQAYVYVSGDVGIRVKIFGKKRGFSIAKLSAAVLMQAKLPNPSWFAGRVGVKYAVLGGIVKGTANISIELGTQCDIQGAKELNVVVINDIKPADQDNDVSVFAIPQVAFNMPVGKSFSMLNENDEVATYRIQLDELSLTKDQQKINGTTELAADGQSASLNTRDILPPAAKLTAFAKVHIERQNAGSWIALTNGDKVDYETKSATFLTGEAPDYIPWENVAYTYPVNRQYNFLPKEYSKGYIRLKRGQPYLFAAVDDKGKKWKVSTGFTTPQGQQSPSAVYYDDNAMEASFDIPADLNRESIYTFSIRRASADGEAAANNVSTQQSTEVDASGDTTTYAQNVLKGDATSSATKEVISYNFRTSRYSTLGEKLSQINNPQDMFDVATGYISVIGQQFSTEENFDQFDLQGDAATQPLITMTAGTNNAWVQQILSLVYSTPFGVTDRDIHSTGGVPPLDAIRMYNNNAPVYKLEDNNIKDGFAASYPGLCRFMYYVSFVANGDYHELSSKAIAYLAAGGASGAAITRLIGTLYPDLQGNLFYPVNFQYRLPGKNFITSTYTRSIYYKL